jgi:hypothetical protein
MLAIRFRSTMAVAGMVSKAAIRAVGLTEG